MARLLAALTLLAFGFANLAAWIEHVIVCIHQQAWILLGFGCLIWPVGIVHGWACWFGLC